MVRSALIMDPQPMSSPEPLRVFISYARKDGALLAQRLQADLTKKGLDSWIDTQRIAGSAVWSATIEREIDTRQVTLALLSPGSYTSEICRAEQLRALDKGNRVIPVLAAKGSDRPIYLYARHYRDFTDDAHYSERLEELLGDIRDNATATLPETCRKTPITYLTTPPRVANYLERRESLRALRDAVFAEDRHQPIALTSLAGMGGIGKTVLAKALTEDEVVQRAFPDGIVWITVGKERKRNFIDEMREVAKALGDDLSRYDNALACENQYRTTIMNKAALIVVDDVWSKADIEPLLAESPRSRFLFTTRDASIGRFVSAQDYRVDLLNVAQSRELLALWANLPVAELPEGADDIIAECERLPLAISMLGAMLRGSDREFWKDTLELLRKADLSAIQEQLPQGQESFFKAVEVSFQSLKSEMQERYKALAVLLEDMAVPPAILQIIWGTSDAEARRVSRHLIDRSLAVRTGESGNIRLHDLQLDYVRSLYPDRRALNLIHGAERLSSHVIDRDPAQFGSQLVGRLLRYTQPEEGFPVLHQFARLITAAAPRPWLRPLRPALFPPGTALIRTLTGHSRAVTAVAVNEDGRRAVSASQDGTLKAWDLETGRELSTLDGHSATVNAVAITRDGSRVLSGSSDHTLKVWNLERGRELCTLEGHSASVTGVAVSGDGRRAVSASADWELKVWDLESGRELRTLNGHSNGVTAVAVTPDGQLAVSASDDKTLRVWDLASGCELHTLTGHSDRVISAAMTPDGQLAVSTSFQSLKVWDLESGRELRTLSDPGWVNGVAVRADGRQAVSACADETLKVWDLESGRELCIFRGHSSPVLAVAVSRDWRRAVSASFDKTLKVWNLESDRAMWGPSGHSGRVNGVAVSPNGRRAVSVSHDKTVKVWDLESGVELRALEGHRSQVLGVALTADGRQAVSASYDHSLRVWDLENGREVRTLAAHSAPINHVAVSADGRRAVSASNDRTLKVWDLESGRALRTLNGHSDAVLGVALSSDWRLAVSASLDTLKVWDLESGRVLHTLFGHSGWVHGVAVTADGKRAVSASGDTTLKVWDLDSGVALRTLEGHHDSVYGVAVTADGKRAVSASCDKTVKVWDVDTGAILTTFTCDADVWCCAVSDDRTVVAGDGLGLVHFLSFEMDEYN
jgi:WD40 repeat protein